MQLIRSEFTSSSSDLGNLSSATVTVYITLGAGLQNPVSLRNFLRVRRLPSWFSRKGCLGASNQRDLLQDTTENCVRGDYCTFCLQSRSLSVFPGLRTRWTVSCAFLMQLKLSRPHLSSQSLPSNCTNQGMTPDPQRNQ